METIIYLPDINIGEMICKHLKETGKPKAYLGKKLNMANSNLNRLLRKESLSTKWIYIISSALEYNFFAELCNDTEHARVGYNLVQPLLGKAMTNRLKELRMSQIELASKINISPHEVCKMMKKSYIDSERLISISRVLVYNFFREYYTTDSEITENPLTSSTNLLDRYEQLILTNDNLKKENIKLRSELYEIQQHLSASGIKI
ncbi:MAG: hypothetical protein AUK63_1972 [bacterium P3]|nr:MAG: hypothetical protein AUK63_1972 [bacterium P3]KWW34438.1 MAG: hypothetical protein F083_2469 [bacterium F083]